MHARTMHRFLCTLVIASLLQLLSCREVAAVAAVTKCHYPPGDPGPDTITTINRQVLFAIGAQKSGTTYLFNLLQQHPMLHPVRQTLHQKADNFENRMAAKEPHIMDSSHDIKPDQLVQYAADTRSGWLLDATPDYMDTPVAACRIHRYFTNAKFLVVLRDPVARAVSAWTMVHRNHIFRSSTTHKWFGRQKFIDEVLHEIKYLKRTLNCSLSDDQPGVKNWADCMHNHVPFHSCLAKYNYSQGCMFGFVWKGLFARQMEYWLSLFPTENFHVISFTQLKQDPEKVVDGIFSFLGLQYVKGAPKPHHHPRLQERRVLHNYMSSGKKAKLCEIPEFRECVNVLTQFFTGPQRQLAELLGKHQWADAMTLAEYDCPTNNTHSTHSTQQAVTSDMNPDQHATQLQEDLQ